MTIHIKPWPVITVCEVAANAQSELHFYAHIYVAKTYLTSITAAKHPV